MARGQFGELTPQQSTFLAAYLDPQSDTWSNGYASAIKAGYSEEYAQNITGQMPEWLSGAIRDNSLVQKALHNLNEFLSDRENHAIRADMTKFTLKGLARAKFSERQEHTGPNGGPLQVTFDNAFTPISKASSN